MIGEENNDMEDQIHNKKKTETLIYIHKDDEMMMDAVEGPHKIANWADKVQLHLYAMQFVD